MEAIERARRGDGPTLIEAQTYRFRGHSLADPDELREKKEKEYWQVHPLSWPDIPVSSPICRMVCNLSRGSLSTVTKTNDCVDCQRPVSWNYGTCFQHQLMCRLPQACKPGSLLPITETYYDLDCRSCLLPSPIISSLHHWQSQARSRHDH